MIRHENVSKHQLHRLIRSKKITFGGNLRLKIYGLLDCYSGKRMKKVNRVFFKDEAEALEHGFKACGNCIGVEKKKPHRQGAE